MSDQTNVPGQYYCSTCGFRPSRSHGSNSPASMKNQSLRFLKEREMLIYWLLRAYQSGHREGWESGHSSDETMDGICSVLANLHYDPNLSEDAKTLLKQEPIYFIEPATEAVQ